MYWNNEITAQNQNIPVQHNKKKRIIRWNSDTKVNRGVKMLQTVKAFISSNGYSASASLLKCVSDSGNEKNAYPLHKKTYRYDRIIQTYGKE